MNSKLIEILDALSEKFGIMIDWTQQNVQPYVQDLMHRVVQYKMTTSIISAICCGVVIIISVVLFARNFKKIEWDREGDLEEGCGVNLILTIIAGALIFFGAIIFPKAIINIIQCIYLPEKIILEELQAIIK